ncbi:N-alpha-acetyltransferase 30-like [Coccinella septempunctata]|uniref:N-alpha-acetyltransferase 30-like n=1 Tax=Coccinella septempunctata TaxID=41139 RepID=UPI001D063D74|nr:N-alpha-acetyltransferase 30-like [Coccinella septempunctata]
MNITTNEPNIKLRDDKNDLKVDIIRENNHKKDLKVNGLLNGSGKDLASLKTSKIDAKKRSQGTVENAESKSKVQISMNDNENRPKNSGKTKKDFVCDTNNQVKSCYDSNENITQLSSSQSSTSCKNSIDLGVEENVSCVNCPEDISVPNSECLEVNNMSEDYKTDSVESADEVMMKLENLNIASDESSCKENVESEESPIKYVQYENELQMPLVMKIIQKDLSEPYSIYTYRYFIHNWPKLCFLAMDNEKCVGAIVCKLDIHRKVMKRGYIAMLAVDKDYRKKGIGSTLVKKAIQEMIIGDADEVVLETEVTNQPALQLYEALGFVRDKRLFRYYLNGVDALRLKLWLR